MDAKTISRPLALLMSVGVAVSVLAATPPAEAAKRPTCFGKKATIVSRKKVIRGTNRSEVIVAKGKRPRVIYGKGGNDLICGSGRRKMTIYGGTGNDKIDGRGKGTLCYQQGGTGTITRCGGPLRTLTADKVGSGLVSSSPSGISCGTTCTRKYYDGYPISLTATPDPGMQFAGWTGACTGFAPCQVVMSASRSVTATFALNTQPLTVQKDGSGSGTVQSSPAGVDCGVDCTENITQDTVVTLTATPAVGSLFTGWSGEGCTGTGTCVVTMDAARTVTATFTVARTLTASKDGTGTGTVTSLPVGVSCGADCAEQYADGQSVTLTATPSVGSVFTAWSGCDSESANQCTVAMSTDRAVTATFSASQFSLTVSTTGSGTGDVTSSPAGIACPGDCVEDYPANETVTLDADADPGTVFNGWSGGGCSGTGSCVVTMDQAHSVTATFTVGRTLTVDRDDGTGIGTVTSSPAGITCGGTCSVDFADGATVVLTATPSTGSTFEQWFGCDSTNGNECTVTMGSARTVNAVFILQTYLLTVDRTGQGTVSSDAEAPGIDCGGDCVETYNHGTSLTLSAEAASGWAFSGWGGACTGTGNCNVTMDAAKNVTALFLEKFTLTAAVNGGTGTGSVTSSPSGISCPGTCTKDFVSGTSVTLTPSAATGSTFQGWTGCDSTDGSQCTVAMDAARSVTASFQLNTYLLTVNRTGQGTVTGSVGAINCGAVCSDTYNHGTSVTLSASPAADWVFTGWSGAGCSGIGQCVVTMDAAKTVAATFVERFTLTVDADNGTGTGTVTGTGINCPGDCTQDFNDGAPVTLTAVADAGSTFTGWTGAGCTGTGTCQVTMDDDQTVTATFTRITYALTVSKTGAGTGSITATGINCPGDCSESYDSGTVVTLTATAGGSSAFSGWSGACSGSSATCDVTMDAAKSVTGTFVPAYTLTVTPAGTGSGTVTSDPSGISCGADCTEGYVDGTTVVLTATPASSSTFTSFSGCTSTSENECTVLMSSAKNVTVTFTLKTYQLTVTPAGSGTGTVTSDPEGVGCGATCSASFDHGTSVTLTGTPAVGSRFGSWTGCGSTNGNECTVSMTGAKSVTATFVKVWNLTASKDGNGAGTVSSSPAGIDCGSDCAETYDDGTSVTLTASPGANSLFSGWAGSGCSGTGTCVVTMDATKAVTATFVLETRTLTVEKSGTGAGTVTSNPSGVDCGATCSAGFDHGTGVTLTAAGDATSIFAGWSGSGCSGTGTCVVTMDAAKTVTATFTRLTLSLTKSSMGTVTSSPAGINCASTCTSQSADFGPDTSVTLTASGRTPLIGAYTWGGDCSGTASTCVVTMSQARSVTITIT